MLNIGCHLSASKGYLHMGKQALSIRANTFQFFTRNPRGSKAKAMDPKDAAALMQLTREHNFAPILGHAPYTLNPCSPEAYVREFALLVMSEDLDRMEYLPNNLYNFHPGNHGGQGIEAGIEHITQLLNKVLRPEQSTTVLLEAMSGKGSEVGSRFEEIEAILNGVNLAEKMGVCLDTCHVYSAGYDIVNDLDRVLSQFEQAESHPSERQPDPLCQPQGPPCQNRGGQYRYGRFDKCHQASPAAPPALLSGDPQ